MRLPTLLCLALVLSLAACGGEDKGVITSGNTKPAFLQPDPGTAMTVVDARAKAEGDEVVVEGRVQDINDGFAMFTLYDTGLLYCGQPGTAEVGKNPMDGCLTPWDYCCSDPDEVAAGNMPVEMRDSKGAPVKAEDIGLRLLDLVRVKGKLEKTESGNFILVATSGWFRAERPKLHEDLPWPE